jgi:hypothetical protein
MVSESKIRDFLADNLSFFEPDDYLDFIGKEFLVRSDIGADGRIDILAKDSFGNYVVIEIKKSNSSSRQALHELYKYVTLLRHDFEIPPENIRCIIISTEWHELITSFSEFKRMAEFPVEGIKLILDESTGLPKEKERIRETSIREPKKIYEIHHINLFLKDAYRKESIPILIRQLQAFGVKNFLFIHSEYLGKSEMNIFPFALHLIIYEFNRNEHIAVRKSLIDSDYVDDLNSEEDIDDECSCGEALEEVVLSKLSLESMRRTDPEESYSNLSLEVGYPSKFLSMLQRNWRVTKVDRYGHPEKLKELKADEDLIKEIAGLDGVNPDLFLGVAKSSLKNSWAKFIENMNLFLNFYDEWQWSFNAIIEEYLGRDAEIIISARIYKAVNLLDALCWTSWTSDCYLPTLDILISIPQENSFSILRGFWEWDRKTYPTVDTVFEKGISSTFQECRIMWGTDAAMPLIQMIKHGIQYSVIELSPREKDIKHIDWGEEDVIERNDLDEKRICSLKDFVKENTGYINELKYLFNETSLFPDPLQERINWQNFEDYCLGF